MMLADYLNPPYPAWSVEGLRNVLQPELRPHAKLADLLPEWSSYDALLSLEPEVPYAG
jgi:hypothetical protein